MNKKEEMFIRFVQWSIYTFIFLGLIIWLRLTGASFDFGVLTGFLTGVMLTIALGFLVSYEKERKQNKEGKQNDI